DGRLGHDLLTAGDREREDDEGSEERRRSFHAPRHCNRRAAHDDIVLQAEFAAQREDRGPDRCASGLGRAAHWARGFPAQALPVAASASAPSAASSAARKERTSEGRSWGDFASARESTASTAGGQGARLLAGGAVSCRRRA